MIALVTVHGIGFQQFPVRRMPGYADDLHERLGARLGTLLGDDPHRQRDRPGANGPVYVSSSWPPASNLSEPGMERLGKWGQDPRTVDGSRAPLAGGESQIGHVALVYSHLEGRGPEIGAGLQTATAAALALPRYTSLPGLIRSVVLDVKAMCGHGHGGAGPGLRVRTNPTTWTPETSHSAPASPPADARTTGLFATLRQLENDVAVYVAHNDLRERVRGFVRESLLRLCYRDDISGIVVNSHSNGTVVAFDVLSDLPPSAIGKVAAFVTAGSPLRKYTTLLSWGNQVGRLHEVGRWLNFCDWRDPVADPLRLSSLYQWTDPDTGRSEPARMGDLMVDNVANSQGGGLRAHNYWDNDAQFLGPLADVLRNVCAGHSGR